jgi:hypothetical protein
MKRAEITYSKNATVNVGQYENISPMFCQKVIIEAEDIDSEKEFLEIKTTIDKLINDEIAKIRGEKLLKEMAHIRFSEIDGKKVPHVSSIISPDKLGIPNIELFALRGTLKHKELELYIKSAGKERFTISESDKQKLITIGGIEGFDIEWIKNDERIVFDKDKVEQEVYNEEHLYCGRYDYAGNFVKENALFDLKSGSMDKVCQEKAFIQLSAYARCLKDIKCLVILPCNPKSKKEPIVTNDIPRYFDLFLQKRQEFKQRFGI